MDLNIFWTTFAENELKKIFKYYCENASHDVAKKLVDDIYDATLILKSHPKIGQVEELLKDRIQIFLYLVYKNYKIIYWVNKEMNQIEITDVFDARQNPIKIKRTK